jgi:putative copper export protein/methionine-rich copper-binding protein CopC
METSVVTRWGGTCLRLLGLVVLAVGGLVTGAQTPAGAHTERAGAQPAPGATVAASPGRIELLLTEPTTPLSRISLIGPDGQRVELGPTRVSGRKLSATVGTLTPGDYTVRWAAFSNVDGHLAGGTYRFRVGQGHLAETRSSPLLSGAIVAFWSRLLVLGGGLLWAGSLVLALLAARPGPAAGTPGLTFLGVFGARLRRLTPWAVAAVLVGELTALWMASRGGLPVWTGNFLLGAQAGRLALARLGVLAAGLVVALGLRGNEHSRLVQAPLALAYLGLVAFSGHATLSPAGPLSGPLLDLVHQMAGAAWLGGIALLGWAVRPQEGDAAGVAELARRVSPVALAAAATLWITGVCATEQQTLSLSDLPETVYGRLLVLKLVLVALLVAMSVRSGFVLRPALVRAAPDSPDARRLAGRLLRHLRLEAPVAAAVIACAALLTSRASPLSLAAASRPDTGGSVVPGPVFAEEETGEREVSLSVVPGSVGPNRLLVFLDGPPVEQVRLRLDAPDRPGPSLWVPSREGLSVVDVTFPTPGQWTARVSAGEGEAEFPVSIGDRGAMKGGLEVLTVADLSGPARERCRDEVIGQQVALSEAGRRIVHTVLDAADFRSSAVPGAPSALLGGCGVDAALLEAVANEREIPLLAPEGGTGAPWAWAVEPAPETEGRALARLVWEGMSGRSAAVVAEPGGRFPAAARAFREEFSSAGGTVAGVWELPGSGPGSVIANILPLQVDILVLLGTPEVMVPFAAEVERRDWRPGKGVVAGAPLFGPELAEAAPRWRDDGLLLLAGSHPLSARVVAPYIRGLLATVPGALPSYRGVAGFLQGRLLLDALEGLEPADGDGLRRALDSRFRGVWRPAGITLGWAPGHHSGAEDLALFRFSPPLNIFGLLGGAHARHEVGGGLLYARGDFLRATAFFGASGEPRQE